MPIYEYRCAKDHRFEVFQSMSEDPLSKCSECGAKAERVLSAPAVHFKGSGFYTTDYARKGAKKSGDDSGSSGSGSGSSGSDSASSGSDSGSSGSDSGSSGSDSGSSGSDSSSSSSGKGSGEKSKSASGSD